METATFEDYQALNEQLAALVEAGVPLDIGFVQPDSSVAKALERINATVARRVGRGETLTQALEGDDQDLPPAYRSLVQLGIRSGNISAGLDDSSRVADSFDDSQSAIESAFIYPLIICLLAFAGLICMCLFFVPALASLGESADIEPGPATRILEGLRNTMPYWATFVPLLLIAAIAWRILGRASRRSGGVQIGGLVSWLPGVSQILFQERCARFSASLSELLRDGVPLEESLRIVADGSGDENLRDSGRRLADAVETSGFPPDDGLFAMQFPPFLRWAIWHSEATIGRPQALQIAARMYHDGAERRSERLRHLAPVVALVVLGGTVTLLYGLALFVPMTELLRGLAG
jgi:general secretion pathway protein F